MCRTHGLFEYECAIFFFKLDTNKQQDKERTKSLALWTPLPNLLATARWLLSFSQAGIALFCKPSFTA